MKLERKWLWLARVLLAAVAVCLLGMLGLELWTVHVLKNGAFPSRTVGRLSAALPLLAIACCLGVILPYRRLRCPHCGKGRVSFLRKRDARRHCGCCGKRLLFSGEAPVEEAAEEPEPRPPLKRVRARGVLVLLWSGLLSGFLIAASALFIPVSLGWRLSVLLVLVTSLIMQCRLRCPFCKKGLVPPKWSSWTRTYCTRCGKPILYDDEVRKG